MQPDMVARSKVFWHGFVLIVSGLLLGCVALAASRPEGVPIESAAMSAAVIAGLAALFHLCVAWNNPNEDRAANLRKSEATVFAGNMEIARPGAKDNLIPAPANLTLWHGLALLAVVAAPVAFFAPVFVGLSSGSQANPDMSPSVVSPGETVTLFFRKANVESLSGLWRGQATVQVVNAEELGIAPTLIASSSAEMWPAFRGKIRASNKKADIYLKMALPDNPELAGKTLELKASLVVTFPSTSQGKVVDANTLTLNRDVTLHLTSGQAAIAFREAWSIGSTAGLIASIFGGIVLWSLARGLRAQANPSEVVALGAPPLAAPSTAPAPPPPGARMNEDQVRDFKRRWFQSQ
jgi:hypothetical protein